MKQYNQVNFAIIYLIKKGPKYEIEAWKAVYKLHI